MKTFFSIFFSVFISTYVIAQVDFTEQILIDINTGLDAPTSAFAADIDGDGDMDMLATSRWDDKVVWYENRDGQGDFGPQKIIFNNLDEPGNGVAYDIDGDGDLDVIVATVATSDSNLYWFENEDGQGNFGAQQLIYENIYINRGILMLDFDNDGDLDIGSSTGENVFWLENMDGQGTFSAQQDLTPTSNVNVSDFGFFDMDNDGDLDIICCGANPFFNQPDEIYWFINEDGQGTYGPKQLVSETVEGPTAIDATDVDGDGDLDIVTTSFPDGDVAWHENTDGQGMFDEKVVIDGFVNAKDVLVSDVDNDGDSDLVVGYSSGRIKVFENTNGLGGFEDATVTNLQRTSDLVYTADLDNDGDLDIYSVDVLGHRVAWYENDGQGTFGFQQQITANVTGARKIECADLDNDGDLDMISLSNDFEDNKLAWYENLGNLEFDDQRIIYLTADLMNDFVLHDMNNDGAIDIVGSNDGLANDVFWFQNDGQGNFVVNEVENSTTYARYLQVGDFNGDGFQDVMKGTSSSVSIYMNIGNGAGFFDDVPVASSLQGLKALYATDLDGDGDLDILSASSNDNSIGWHENTDGFGTFSPRQIISVEAWQAYDVYADDMDGDGDMDVLSASYGTSGKIAWYENIDGLGNFATEKIITQNAENGRVVRTKDLDGDGDADVVAAFGKEVGSGTSDKVTWYENLDGQGNFSGERVLIVDGDADGTRSIHCEDFDGDGDFDIAVASEFDDLIVMFENEGLNSNRITGQVRLDLEGNGCDANDANVANLYVQATGANDLITFTLQNGFYQFNVEEGTYNTTLSVPDYYDVSPADNTSNFVGIGNVDNADFCLSPNQSVNDLNVTILPLTEARPGFEATYQLAYKNMGTAPTSGTIFIDFPDESMTFLSASEVPTTQQANSITFDYTDLNPFENRTINMTFEVMEPPIVASGDTILLATIITPSSGDITILDNSYELYQTVVNSYDPNDITVLEGAEILLEEVSNYLHYLIRFQNTGTASAINVRIDNILDADLDWSTIEIIGSSHFMRTEISNGNEISFVFDNINLPDSTFNLAASQGYISYKIKPKTTSVLGDQFTNTADIFFDFNAAITTNTVVTTIVGLPDTIAPVALCQNAIIELGDNGNGEVLVSDIDNGSTDNVGIENYNLSISTVDCSDVGDVDVVLEVQDASGNTSSCLAQISVIDNLSPTVILQDITVDLSGNSSITVTPDQVDNGTVDNCGLQTLNLEPSSYSEVSVYAAIFTALDVNNNESSEAVIVTVVNSLSTKDDLEKNLSITPNPVHNELNIELSNYEMESVEIHSVHGELMLQTEEKLINVEELNSGVYYVSIKTKTGASLTKKIVKL